MNPLDPLWAHGTHLSSMLQAPFIPWRQGTPGENQHKLRRCTVSAQRLRGRGGGVWYAACSARRRTERITMTADQISALIAAISATAALLTAIAGLLKAFQNGGVLEKVHENTNTTNANLQTTISTLTAGQATPEELEARRSQPPGA